jgi:hypothetical protein
MPGSVWITRIGSPNVPGMLVSCWRWSVRRVTSRTSRSPSMTVSYGLPPLGFIHSRTSTFSRFASEIGRSSRSYLGSTARIL